MYTKKIRYVNSASACGYQIEAQGAPLSSRVHPWHPAGYVLVASGVDFQMWLGEGARAKVGPWFIWALLYTMGLFGATGTHSELDGPTSGTKGPFTLQSPQLRPMGPFWATGAHSEHDGPHFGNQGNVSMLQDPPVVYDGPLLGYRSSRSSRSSLREIRGLFHAAGPVLYTMGPFWAAGAPGAPGAHFENKVTLACCRAPYCTRSGPFWAGGPYFANQGNFSMLQDPLLYTMEPLLGYRGLRSSRSPLREIRGPFHAVEPLLCTTGLLWAAGSLSGFEGPQSGYLGALPRFRAPGFTR